MDFRIADTFTASLTRLTNAEQKDVKTTAFELQLDPTGTGKSFHRLDNARDRNFWSVRVSRDIRIIVHRTGDSLLLCYVDHHDQAYAWAERRKIETHPQTGAAQLVEIRETVQEIFVPQYVSTPQALPALFATYSDEQLLRYGVPMEWLHDVHTATEESLLKLVDYLPGEAAEALLELATGGTPHMAMVTVQSIDPFEHPDAQRRFRTIPDFEELKRALDAPWEKWTVFLHPDQRKIVQQSFQGPARVSGTAGTGKTIVALHRAVALAQAYPDTRVLLTTFSNILAQRLRVLLRYLVSEEHQPRLAEHIEVYALNTIGERLYTQRQGRIQIADNVLIRDLIKEAATAVGNHSFSERFLREEWEQIVDAWQLKSWEAYRSVARLGRKTRLSEQHRQTLWSIMEHVQRALDTRHMITYAGLFTTLAELIKQEQHRPFDFVVVDEAQDISIPHLRFLAALSEGKPDALFFAGDLGQRIFQQPFSWKSLGVDIRGRSHTLRVNYRTSHQIRMQADKLLDKQLSDVDGNVVARNDTISVLNGPDPCIRILATKKEEQEYVLSWIHERLEAGRYPHEIAVFVRSAAELERAKEAVKATGVAFNILDEHVDIRDGHIAVSTMHYAKGLEFRAVVVMACDNDVIPSQERIEEIGDEADLEEVYTTERHLLYVACTRARDHLLITGVEPASEFLDDIRKM